MTRKITVREGQTLSDIAIQETGDVQRVFEIAQVNGLSITSDLFPAMQITVPDAALDKLHIVNEFAARPHKPASALTADDQNEMKGGIGYMGIGIDFKVS